MRHRHYQAIRSIGWGLLQLVIASGLFLSVSHNTVAAMPQSLAVELEHLGLPATAISLYVHRLGDDQPLLTHLADRPRNPASTMKLVTTAAALDLLTPTHTWQTHTYVLGQLQRGTLDGDLLIQGSGDPQLVIEDFWRLIENLRQRGLRHITGDLILDSSLFDRSAINTKPLDHKRYRAYNTPPDALLVNFRATRLEVFPEGQSLRIYADPPATTLRLENHIKVLTGRCKGRTGGITLTVERQASGTLAKLGGRYPVTCGPTGFGRVLLTQDAYVYGVFRHLWLASGGTLRGTWRSGVAPTNQRAFASHRSDPLASTVRDINKFSNNVMARNLLLTLAAKRTQGVATPSDGRAAVLAWLAQAGIRMPHLAMDNGAGLSRSARLSARGLGQLLLHAWHGPWGPEFISSLPLAGMDGSLRQRFRGLAPEGGRIRLKTGRLSGVRAMAGYVTLSDNQTHAVVILINQEKLSNRIGDAAPAAVLRWLLRPR